MITSTKELNVALRNLKQVEDALETLRVEMQSQNPALFPVVSQTYTCRLRALQDEVFAYLRSTPTETALRIRLQGEATPSGTAPIGVIARFLQGLQKVYQQEKQSVIASLLAVSGNGPTPFTLLLPDLNLVATEAGSFILALELPIRQLSLYPEYDFAEQALLHMMEHLSELSNPDASFTGDRSLLRAIEKMAFLLKPSRISQIEFSYRAEQNRREVTLTDAVQSRISQLLGQPLQGEETVRGQLFTINIENNTCRLRPEGEQVVECGYAEDLEDDLISAVKRRVEVSGVMVSSSGLNRPRRIKHIEHLKVLDMDEFPLVV